MEEKKVLVTELFESFQGEGPNIGKPSLFVRFFGCNNACNFCDSKYSVKKDDTSNIKSFTYKELFNRILFSNFDNVVFTGGEPLLQEDFLRYFIEQHYAGSIEIETNGTFGMLGISEVGQINISPKLSNSGNHITPEYLDNIIKNVAAIFDINENVILKFVVNTEYLKNDIYEISSFLKKLNQTMNPDELFTFSNIYLMPMGTDAETIKHGIDVLAKEAKNIPFPFIISPRLHVLVYGNKRCV